MTQKRPNFLLILADDLGFSDIGCFGSEIRTPNLDKLAADGLRFTDYHTASLCSPTRSMLLTGTDCHMAGVGVMAEFACIAPERWNSPGHVGYMNHDVACVADLLQDAGYYTVMAGKWHLGYKDECGPHHRGFMKSFAMLPGGANHWGWEPDWAAREAEKKRPHKWMPGHSPPLYSVNGYRYLPKPNTTRDPEKGFYSSTTFTSRLLNFLDERPDPQQPFFAYLAFSAPHFPLQCPAQDREHYKGMYDDGPDALRARRLEKMKTMGIVPPDVVPHKVEAGHLPSWTDMTPEQKKLSAGSQEVFSGMVERIDKCVGQVVEYLKSIGEYDNTVILFHSDNGAEGAAEEIAPAISSDLVQTVKKYYNNSYDNLGAHDSFCWYGPRWAQASTAPSRLFKAYTTEGGIRVPLVIRYPPWTKRQAPGAILPAFSTCMDVVPTMLEMAGAKHPNPHPKEPRDKAPYKKTQVFGVRGKSWVPFLSNGELAEHSPVAAIHGSADPPMGWEMHGKAALRQGLWKINFMNANDFGTGEWELHNLETDPAEAIDLSKKNPEKLKELIAEFDKWVKETGTAWGPPVDMWGERKKLPEDWIGGDILNDQRVWMYTPEGSMPSQSSFVAGKGM